MKFYTACGIEDTCARGLLGVAGKMPAKQSALQNNLKSEANHRLGYFFAQNRITPRSRSPPDLDFYS